MTRIKIFANNTGKPELKWVTVDRPFEEVCQDISFSNTITAVDHIAYFATEILAVERKVSDENN